MRSRYDDEDRDSWNAEYDPDDVDAMTQEEIIEYEEYWIRQHCKNYIDSLDDDDPMKLDYIDTMRKEASR
jgi:hypothetical protein